MASTDVRVQDEVLRAYYASVVSQPQNARNQAQVSFTISSAIATALIATGAFSGFGSKPVELKLAGIASLVLWLAAAALFVRAVASPVSRTTGDISAASFVAVVLNNITTERNEVLNRQRRAHAVAALAATVTLALVICLVAEGDQGPEPTEVRVFLTSAGAQLLARVCNARLPDIMAEVDRTTLTEQSIELRDVRCGTRRVRLILPRSAVLGIDG